MGVGYVMFYEDKEAQKPPGISLKKKRENPAYENTLNLLKKGKTIWQIAEILDIHPNSVWNHIAQAFKKKVMPPNQLVEIIKTRCKKDIKDDALIFLEKIKRNEIEEGFLKEIKELKALFYKEHKYYLPINMMECISLYLDFLYKK